VAVEVLPVHLGQVKTAATYLVQLTHLVHLEAVVAQTAGLQLLALTHQPPRLLVLAAQVMGGQEVVRLQQQVLRLEMELMAAAGVEVKTPLGS
jgi:hypothetical protein